MLLNNAQACIPNLVNFFVCAYSFQCILSVVRIPRKSKGRKDIKNTWSVQMKIISNLASMQTYIKPVNK